MKKIFTLMLCALIITVSMSCNYELSEQEKAVKARVKDLKNDGFNVVDDEDMDMVISRHEEKKVNDSTLCEYWGMSENDCESIDSGKVSALKDVAAEQGKNYVKVLKENLDSNLFDNSKSDAFLLTVESIYAKKLEAELIPSYYCYKKFDDGKYYVIGYFLISSKKMMEVMMASEVEAAAEMKVVEN